VTSNFPKGAWFDGVLNSDTSFEDMVAYEFSSWLILCDNVRRTQAILEELVKFIETVPSGNHLKAILIRVEEPCASDRLAIICLGSISLRSEPPAYR